MICLAEAPATRERHQIDALHLGIAVVPLDRAAADRDAVLAQHEEEDLVVGMLRRRDAEIRLRRIERGGIRDRGLSAVAVASGVSPARA